VTTLNVIVICLPTDGNSCVIGSETCRLISAKRSEIDCVIVNEQCGQEQVIGLTKV
jgi:hypothetical protein